jgi:hypothetical protein
MPTSAEHPDLDADHFVFTTRLLVVVVDYED